MKTSQKGFISPLLLALIALLLIGGGVYVYVQNKPVKQSEMVSSAVATSTEQTSDWKTFNFSKYGYSFSFKYPMDWVVSEGVNQDGSFYVSGTAPLIGKVDTNSLRGGFSVTNTEDYDYCKDLPQSQFNFGKAKDTGWTTSAPENRFTDNRFICVNNPPLTINMGTVKLESKDILEDILVSFKFTN